MRVLPKIRRSTRMFICIRTNHTCLYGAIFKDPDLFFFLEAAEFYLVFQIIDFH